MSWKTFFLKNHTRNVVEKLFPDPFLKNQNWAYLWINSLKFYTVRFYCMSRWRLPKYIKTKLYRPIDFTSHKAPLKKKKKSRTSFPPSFSARFLKKNISLVIFYQLNKFHCLATFTLWEFGQYVYCNCLLTKFWRDKFNLISLIRPFVLRDQKIKTKI